MTTSNILHGKFLLIFDQNNPLKVVLKFFKCIINLMLHAAPLRFIENAVSEFEN